MIYLTDNTISTGEALLANLGNWLKKGALCPWSEQGERQKSGDAIIERQNLHRYKTGNFKGALLQSQKVGNNTNSDILGSSRLSKVANHSSPTAVPNEMGYVMLPGCSGSTWRSALAAHRIGTHVHTPHPVACVNELHTVLGKPYPCTHTSY